MDKGDVLGRSVATALSSDSGGAGASVVAVACSGGRDSMAMLDVVVRWACGQEGVRVMALHVHHGLSVWADQWEAHVASWCTRQAAQGFDVGFASKRVQLCLGSGESLEAQAREARYAALAEMAHAAGAGQIVLAHHMEDQAETFLLQALRGAGPRGLSAMPVRRLAFGVTWLRPWLACERALIEGHVRELDVPYVDDDSNTDPRFARNRLRHEVWPLLEKASPGAARMLARCAGLVQEAAECQSDRAAVDLGGVRAPTGALDVHRLQRLGGSRRRAVLHLWVGEDLGLPVRHRDIVRLDAEVGGVRAVGRWPGPQGGEFRQYKGELSWCSALAGRPRSPNPSWLPGARPAQRTVIDGGIGIDVPHGGGRIWIRLPQASEPALALLNWEALEWRRREGGETFQFSPLSIPRALRKQFQARGLPAWERPEWLLWEGDRLVFVPGLGLDARCWVPSTHPECTALVWQPPSGA